jgi:hypothetical protein
MFSGCGLGWMAVLEEVDSMELGKGAVRLLALDLTAASL